MAEQKTFRNLQVLQDTRNVVRLALKDKYQSAVEPCIKIIEMVMRGNEENHFEAVKRIQNNSDMMDTLQKKGLFSSALMELVDREVAKDLQYEQ